MEKVFWSHVMNLVKMRRYIKAKGICRCASIAALFAGASGCMLTNPNGFELYSSLGARAVHTHEEKATTVEQKCGGLRGWVMGCVAAPTREGN